MLLIWELEAKQATQGLTLDELADLKILQWGRTPLHLEPTESVINKIYGPGGTLWQGLESLGTGARFSKKTPANVTPSRAQLFRQTANIRPPVIKAPVSGKPPIVGPVRSYDEATKARIPGYDNHHLDPKSGRVDPNYPKGPTIGVRNDNSGGRVPGGVNLHTAKGGFQTSLNDHIKKDLGFTMKQWNELPDATRQLHLRRYYASLGIPFPF
jgi:hypothetical protein